MTTPKKSDLTKENLQLKKRNRELSSYLFGIQKIMQHLTISPQERLEQITKIFEQYLSGR